MGKHAYLVMAHNQPELLNMLLKLLDSPWNDFYIHIDKNAKVFAVDTAIQGVCESPIEFVKRIPVEQSRIL